MATASTSVETATGAPRANAKTTRPWRLSGSTRKAVLVVHILSAAAWFGIDLALITVVLVAMLTSDPQTAATAMQAADLFAIVPMLIAAIACLVTGATLGLGSKYGLVKYRWVTVKLAINVVFMVLIVTALRTGIDEVAALGKQLAAGDPSATVPLNMLGPVIVAPTLLITAFLLSVFKPWGRMRKAKAASA